MYVVTPVWYVYDIDDGMEDNKDKMYFWQLLLFFMVWILILRLYFNEVFFIGSLKVI